MKPMPRAPLTFQRTGPPAKLVKVMPKRKPPSDIEKASRQIALPSESFDPTMAEIKPDKITLAVLDETLSDDQKEVVIQFFKDRVNKKSLHSLPAKGTGFNRRYVKKYDGGFTLEFRLDPSRRDHNRQFMNFTFNPSWMKRRHTRSLQSLMKHLFPGYWLKVVKELRLYRFDVCVDLPVDNDRLIIRRGRNVSGVKYVIAHNRYVN